MSTDNINPDYYQDHPAGIDCIDVVEHLPYNIGNAIKYLWRCGKKDGNPSAQDLEKARWHIQREIERLEKSNRKMDFKKANTPTKT